MGAPDQWSKLLLRSADELATVELRWMRGSSAAGYQLVPDFETPQESRDPHHPRASVAWAVVDNETRDLTYRRARDLADDLWSLAEEFAGWFFRDELEHGGQLNVQLRGVGAEDQQLFTRGARVIVPNLSEIIGSTPSVADELEDEDQREAFSAMANSLHAMRKVLGDVEKRANDDHRRWTEEKTESYAAVKAAHELTNRTVATMPDLLSSAAKVVGQGANMALEFGERIVRGGDREIEELSKAYQARASVQRAEKWAEVGRHAIDSLVAEGGRLVTQLLNIYGAQRGAQPIPVFDSLQQGAQYLALTLTEDGVGSVFRSMQRDTPLTAGELSDLTRQLLEVLQRAAALESEQEAAAIVVRIVWVFRSAAWDRYVDDAQRATSRFIVGRVAVWRVQESGGQGH